MPKTCLTNHKGSISHHIMPQVINSLGGGHTHTHTHTQHHRQKLFQENSYTSNKCQQAPGLKINNDETCGKIIICVATHTTMYIHK